MRAPLAPIAAFFFALPTSVAMAKDPILVKMDVSAVMRLTVPANTVVVGNPGIADVTIHDRQTLIITGRIVGATNLVVLDGKGQVIAEETIHVQRVQAGYVTVQRGPNRFTYGCTPHCSPMVDVGDQNDHLSTASQQMKTRGEIASSGTQ